MESIIYISRCTHYDSASIYRHVDRFFNCLGGIANYIRPGMKVLLKPNLCLPHLPETAITTHPALLEQIVKILLEHGATVTIGDNPIGKNKRELIERIWEVTGISGITDRYHCDKSFLERDGFRKETMRVNGKAFSYYISREYLNADIVINVPKFKTHGLMGFTGAVKNIFGIVPGRSKVRLHSLAPSIEDFSQVIVDVFSKRVPELTVMDAIEGLEGNGPGVKGKKKHIGLFMASNDGVLIDAMATKIMGMQIEDIITTIDAEKKNLGNIAAKHLYLEGFNTMGDIIIKDFSLPDTRQYRNSRVIQKIYDIAKFNLSIDVNACEGCLLCCENCPVHAIHQCGDRLYIDGESCIQCLCCLEICPHGAVNASVNKFYAELKRLKGRRSDE